MTDTPKIRLHIDASLGTGEEIALDASQSNYLFNVMRLRDGDLVALFNNTSGEWRAHVTRAHRKSGILDVTEQLRAPETPPQLALIFAPIKKARTDFIVEKASELGVAEVQPVFTRYTNAERLNLDRLRAHMIEAAEQCGGVSVPLLHEPKKLDALLLGWPPDRLLIFCDEARTAAPIPEALSDIAPGSPASVLIGPEGGFAPEEVARLRAIPTTRAVSLGQRILRADTAAVAALALTRSVLFP